MRVHKGTPLSLESHVLASQRVALNAYLLTFFSSSLNFPSTWTTTLTTLILVSLILHLFYARKENLVIYLHKNNSPFIYFSSKFWPFNHLIVFEASGWVILLTFIPHLMKFLSFYYFCSFFAYGCLNLFDFMNFILIVFEASWWGNLTYIPTPFDEFPFFLLFLFLFCIRVLEFV